jgi:hypothetical protein
MLLYFQVILKEVLSNVDYLVLLVEVVVVEVRVEVVELEVLEQLFQVLVVNRSFNTQQHILLQ